MRGDRPEHILSFTRTMMFTPHARGSTAFEEEWRRQYLVYPACAGIDPQFEIAGDFEHGLPRMRGDRPVDIAITHAFFPFTPHARGSTL